MKNLNSLLPSKLKYKVMVGFCLMSILPLLAGVYVASPIIYFPFEENSGRVLVISLVSIFSLLLSLLGYYITRQMMMPIPEVSAAARNIAEGKLDEEEPVVTPGDTEEIQELTRSLKMISRNAKELLGQVEKLSLRDKLTGLYNAHYIRERLDEEIQRAIHYQQPCSFAYLFIHNYDSYASQHGEKELEEALKKVAQSISDQLREFDRAARIGRGEFAIIFPDKNKKKIIEIMEKMGREILATNRLLPCIGVSENPIDGVHADGLFLKAQDRMKAAKQNGKLLEAFA